MEHRTTVEPKHTFLLHIFGKFGIQKICHFFVFFFFPVEIEQRINLKYTEIHEYIKHLDYNLKSSITFRLQKRSWLGMADRNSM